MKLTGLDKPLKLFGGEPIEQAEGKALTVRDTLLSCLTRMKAGKDVEGFHVYKLGTEIFAAKGECPIESKDMALLKLAVTENGPEFVAFVQGQVKAYLEDIDTADKKAEL